MKLRILISFLFSLHMLVNNFTYASQLLPNNNSAKHHSLSDKYILAKSLIQNGKLEEKNFESKHLSLFDKYKHLPEMTRKKMPDGKSITNITSYDLFDKMLEFKVRSVVGSNEYLKEIFRVAKEYNIDPLLLHSIAETESGYNPLAISPAGAKGLMQIMPDTARRFGMQDPETELLDPWSNLRISSNYIRTLHALFGNNLELILAAYNAGENAVIKYGYRIPPYQETQQYVTKVMNRYLELKNLSMRF